MLFQQNSTYRKISQKDGKEREQIFSYSKKIRLFSLKDRPEKKIFYDKELKMHFESERSYRTFKIEVVDVSVDFDKEFKKSQDLLRRLSYRYDWLEVERCSDGKITNIGNLDELRSNWSLLEQKIRKDYAGAIVDGHLVNISNQFADAAHFMSIFNQYKEYGLLFLEIPARSGHNWQGKRIINIDTHPFSPLMETITLIDENEKYKICSIKLEQCLDSPITLIEAAGELKWNKKCGMPQTVNAKVRYYYDETIINEWDFRTERIFE
jgi:hypothetical protein